MRFVFMQANICDSLCFLSEYLVQLFFASALYGCFKRTIERICIRFRKRIFDSLGLWILSPLIGATGGYYCCCSCSCICVVVVVVVLVFLSLYSCYCYCNCTFAACWSNAWLLLPMTLIYRSSSFNPIDKKENRRDILWFGL